MITMTPDTHEQVLASAQRTLPANPFPRKYIHCVFDDQQDALQALFTLLAADYVSSNMHILTGQQYMEAVERGQSLLSSLFSINLDEYRYESQRGHHILVVRISRYEQLEQVRNLLVPHRAHLMKYIDTWTFTDLLP